MITKTKTGEKRRKTQQTPTNVQLPLDALYTLSQRCGELLLESIITMLTGYGDAQTRDRIIAYAAIEGEMTNGELKELDKELAQFL